MRSDGECRTQGFLFSNTDSWRLFSAQHKGCAVFYLCWRWIWTIFFLVFLVISGALPQTWYLYENERLKWFIYLTNWGFLLFTIAQLMNAITATAGYFTKDKSNDIKWYMKLNWFLYEFSSAEAVVITLLFWGLLYSPDFEAVPDTYITHGVNAIHVILDIWITAMPIRALHFYIPLSFGLLYVIFTIIYDYAGGTNAMRDPYIYSLLDWSDGTILPPVYATGSVVALVIVHFILFGFSKLRIFIYMKCCPTSTHSIDPNEKSRYDTVEIREY